MDGDSERGSGSRKHQCLGLGTPPFGPCREALRGLRCPLISTPAPTLTPVSPHLPAGVPSALVDSHAERSLDSPTDIGDTPCLRESSQALPKARGPQELASRPDVRPYAPPRHSALRSDGPQTREGPGQGAPTAPPGQHPLPLPSHRRRCLSLANFPPAACPTDLSRRNGHLGRTGRGRATGPNRDGGRGPERVARAGAAGARAPPRPRAVPPPRRRPRPLTRCSTRASCCASARSTLTASHPTGERVGGAFEGGSQAQGDQ